MSNIPTNEVPRIQTRANVGSRALDNGLQNLRNRHNELVTTVSNINTSGSGSEVSTARPNHSDLLNRLNDITKPFPNAVNGLKVVEDSGSASMSVEIESGNGSVAGVQVSKTSTTTGLTLTAPTTNPYYAIIYINSSNTIAVTYGVEATEPVYPNIADTQKALGLVYLDTSTTTISNSDIIDVRAWGLYKTGQDGSFEYQFNLENITGVNSNEKYTLIGNYKKATEWQITPQSNTSFDLTAFSLETFASSPSHGVEVVLGSNVESVHFFGGNITPDGSADHGLNITGDSTNTNINFSGIKIDNTSANEDVSIGAIGQINITGDFETVDNSAIDYYLSYNNIIDSSKQKINIYRNTAPTYYDFGINFNSLSGTGVELLDTFSGIGVGFYQVAINLRLSYSQGDGDLVAGLVYISDSSSSVSPTSEFKGHNGIEYRLEGNGLTSIFLDNRIIINGVLDFTSATKTIHLIVNKTTNDNTHSMGTGTAIFTRM